MEDEQRSYHAKRASEEMELSARAQTELARRSHRELAELHSAKASGGVADLVEAPTQRGRAVPA